MIRLLIVLALLTGCASAPPAQPITPVKEFVQVDPNALIPCPLLPPPSEFIEAHYIEVINLYGNCRRSDQLKLDTIKLLSNTK